MDQHLSANSIESDVERVEYAKTGTRLANELAAAGAAYLAHMRTAGGIAAIPGTDPQQYVVAGTLAMIGQVLPLPVGQPPGLTKLAGVQLHKFYVDAAGGVDEGLVAVANAAIADYLARQSPAPIPEQVAQGSGIEGLTRYSSSRKYLGAVERDDAGAYVKFADVERILATEIAWRDATIVDLSGKLVDAESRLATQSAKQGAQPELPAILFDGNAVYDEVLGRSSRTSAENVSDVLDAVVRLMRKEVIQRAAKAETAERIAFFRQASTFGPWIECKPDHPDAVRFIAPTTSTVSASGTLAASEDVRNQALDDAAILMLSHGEPEMAQLIRAMKSERIDRASTAGAESGGKGGKS